MVYVGPLNWRGQNFGVGIVVVRMAWVHKILFKFLSSFSITTTLTHCLIFSIFV